MRSSTFPEIDVGVVEDALQLPEKMKEARRWLVWKLVPNSKPEKKPRKVPYYVSGKPRNGQTDTPDDYANLATYDDACKVLARGGYAGLGFALGPDGTGNHWQGVDFDDIPTRPHLQALREKAPGVVEVSPSGDGLHFIGYGRDFDTLGSNASGIEAYAKGRYFTVTEQVRGGALVDLSEFVEAALRTEHQRHAPAKPQREQIQQQPRRQDFTPLPDERKLLEDLRSALAYLNADDYEEWINAGHDLKTLGESGRALWLDWSQQSSRFDWAESEKKWNGFDPNRTGYKNVFSKAQDRGWRNPGSRQQRNAALADFGQTFPPLADPDTGELIEAASDPLSVLEGFALNGQSGSMRAKMLDDVHILGQMALMGQITAFFTERNGGKTLLTLWLLIDSIKRGVIQAKDVYYINSDDTHKGLVEKIEFAETWGFKMLADSYNGFKNEMLTDVMRGLCESGQARGKVFILDTLKKFTDVMKIEKGTAFMKDLRAFVLQGGSVILLGHVNKHRGDDGKLVYKGTTDVVDDCDCYYMMDKVQRQERTIVTFENGKARGDVVMKASYSFHRRAEGGQSYADLLDTVQAADENDVVAARVEEERAAFNANNRNIVEAITEAIQAGKVLRTELVNAAHDASGESKKKVMTVLDTLTGDDYWGQGHRWQVSKGQTSGKVYSLLPALLNGQDMDGPLEGEFSSD